MTVSPIDLVTGGIINQSGLSLTTHGLLILQAGSGAAGAIDESLRVDARLVFDPLTLAADVALFEGDLEKENGLGTALLLSLFTDARANDEELARYGGNDPRGFWGDELAAFDGDAWGSKLWLLEREVATTETLNRAREYAAAATDWIVLDGIAESIVIDAAYLQRTFLALGVSVKRGGADERFAYVWGGI